MNVRELPEDVRRVLIRELELSEDEVARMGVREAFDAWLRWEGMIGYTGKIMRAFEGIRTAMGPHARLEALLAEIEDVREAYGDHSIVGVHLNDAHADVQEAMNAIEQTELVGVARDE